MNDSTKDSIKKETQTKSHKKKKSPKNPFDDFLEELEGYDDGCEAPSPIISSGY